ncbi:hypothetical protein C8Q77DRAFT_1074746 [Trametes polyzona]|nr:hypothetical protein C8Q77DRAFT_1074746 [Trametes polyzona]
MNTSHFVRGGSPPTPNVGVTLEREEIPAITYMVNDAEEAVYVLVTEGRLERKLGELEVHPRHPRSPGFFIESGLGRFPTPTLEIFELKDFCRSHDLGYRSMAWRQEDVLVKEDTVVKEDVAVKEDMVMEEEMPAKQGGILAKQGSILAKQGNMPVKGGLQVRHVFSREGKRLPPLLERRDFICGRGSY